MARTSDIVVAFMAAHGNRALASGTPIQYGRLRNMYKSDEECTGCARFLVDGHPALAFEAWALQSGVARLRIIHPTRLLASPPRLHATKETARSVTGELSGGSNLVFVARRVDADDLYLVTQADAPRVTLEDADVVAFIENDTSSRELKACWLEWNASEHWLAEAEWAGFARAARASLEQRMLNVASRVLARTNVTDETRRAWHELVRQHRPEPILAYDFRFLARCEPLASLVTDRELARRNLVRAVEDAHAFAHSSSLAAWAATFAEARRLLDAQGGSGLGTKLFEGALAPEAVSMLDSAWMADVFGGMASWNDVDPPDGYDRVSHALRTALQDAVEAAVNA